MNGKYLVLYERGKFFIESGTVHTFQTWINNIDRSLILMPRSNIVIKRLEYFIKIGEIDNALFLWQKICENSQHIELIGKISKILTIIFAIIYIFLIIISIK